MLSNNDKIILDLCGGSGSWSKPYREAGYDVRVLTLPDWDITEEVVLNPKVRFDDMYEFYKLAFRPYKGKSKEICDVTKVYGILAAPPCTEFSIAKSTAPRDLTEGMKTVEACLNIIWICQKYGHLKFWALENPKGLLVRFLGHPAFKFEQWQFGGTIEKPTYLWGYFKPPIPTIKEKPYIEKFRNKIDNHNLNSREYGSPVCPDEYKDYVSQFTNYKDRRAAIRAITPAGFAEAFYKANK